MSEIFTNGQLFISLLTIIGGGIVSLAAALRWGLKYVDQRVRLHSDSEKQARERLQTALEARIAELDSQVRRLHKREAVYLHRIYQLEAVIVSAGMTLPFLQGWPPEAPR